MSTRNFTRNTFLTVLLISISLFLNEGIKAQTDAMFTKYMFNSLTTNPAYAGSKENMILNVLHRTQWLGIKGAPHTQTFTIHSPLKGFDRLGLGFNLINQNVGTSRTTTANLSYAYRIRFGKDAKAGTLAIGMQGGITNWRANLKNINIYSETDEAFSEEFPSYWLPNFGMGIYYYSKHFFMGASSPNILEHDLRKLDVTTDRNARTIRHYYFNVGGAIPLKGEDLVFKPMLLVKNAGILSRFKNEDDPYNSYNTPTEFSADVSFFIRETLWIGTSFRSSIEKFIGEKSSFDSVDIWAAYHAPKGLIIGLAYDYTLTELQQPSKVSFEVMVGYNFDVSTPKAYSPRYF